MTRRRITEYPDVDLEREMRVCHRWGGNFLSAWEMYKVGCRVYERDPRTIHERLANAPEYNYSMRPDWVQAVRPGTLLLRRWTIGLLRRP